MATTRDDFELIHGDLNESSYEDRAQYIGDAVVAAGNENNVRVEMQPWAPYGQATGIELTDFYADQPGDGGGTKTMKVIEKMADELEISVYLRPSSPRNREFYARFGFITDKSHFGFLARYPVFINDDDDEDSLIKTIKLDLFDPEILFDQLNSGVPAGVLSKLDGTKYPHWDILHSFFLSKDETKREQWARCLRVLISENAPIEHGEMSIGNMLSFGRWDPTPDLSSSLARAYIDAGIFNIEQKLPGQLQNKESDRMGVDGRDKGQMPLSSAIRWGNHGLVRVLCEAGVSLNLGPVVADGPDRDAYEYATEFVSCEVTSVLAEYLMRQRLGNPRSNHSDTKSSQLFRKPMRV